MKDDAATQVHFAAVTQRGSPVRLEYRWVGRMDRAAPLLVFLHEGLGSTSMWKDFPARLCEAGGLRGLVYSRAGYGHSTPRAFPHLGPSRTSGLPAPKAFPHLAPSRTQRLPAPNACPHPTRSRT